MRLLPDVGPKRVVICLASEQAFKDIPDVGEDIKVVAGCATDKCHEIRSAIASLDTAYYQPDGMTFSEKMLLGLSSDSRKALTRRRDIHEAI